MENCDLDCWLEEMDRAYDEYKDDMAELYYAQREQDKAKKEEEILRIRDE